MQTRQRAKEVIADGSNNFSSFLYRSVPVVVGVIVVVVVQSPLVTVVGNLIEINL